MTDEVFKRIKENDKRGIIKRELCNEIERYVKSFIPLRLFWEQSALNKIDYYYYLQNALPHIVSENVIQMYILKILIQTHSDKSTWTPPCRKAEMERIFGMNDKGMNVPSYQWCLDNYRYVFYNLFTDDLRYPPEIVKRVITHFENNEPLADVYKDFSDLFFLNNSLPYMQFIAAVLTRYDDEQLINYFNVVIKKYISELKCYRTGYAQIQDILLYVFGHYFAHNFFAKEVRNKTTDQLSAPKIHLKSVFLRTAWPYIYAYYSVRHDSAYKMMQLTPEEVDEFNQKYFSKKLRTNEIVKNNTIINLEETVFPNGSTSKEIRRWVVCYFQTHVPSRTIPTKKEIIKYVRNVNAKSTPVILDIKHMQGNSLFRRYFSQIVDEVSNEFRAKYACTNDEEILSLKSRIRLYIYHRGIFRYKDVDVSKTNGTRFHDELIIFRRTFLAGDNCTFNKIEKFHYVCAFVTRLIRNFKLNGCADVRKEHIYLCLHELQTERYNPQTIATILHVFKDFIETICKDTKYEYSPISNPAARIRTMNTRGFLKNRPVIPEDVLVFIDDHLWELDEDFRLIYQILRITLWRFGEVADLRTNCFFDIEIPGFMGIRTKVSKTSAALRKSNMSDEAEDVIPTELYLQIKDYMEATAAARKQFGTDLLFFQGRNNVAANLNSIAFNREINELLGRHGIKSIDESYTHFSSAQTRPTGSTMLIEAGVGLDEIQRKLNHKHREITATHYAHARKEHLAQRDKKFFDANFSHLLDEKNPTMTTKYERQALYQKFDMVRRKIEFGECAGECSHHGTNECASCPKLITGPQYLPTWEQYKSNAEKRLLELQTIYDTKGISKTTYEEFSEYKELVRTAEAYRSVIEKIQQYEGAK